MLKGFKDFIMRGNVVDLAVAVVIGAAFSRVIDALVEGLLTPLIGAIGGVSDFSNATFTINDSIFRYGTVINALISFLLVAAAIYFFVILPLKKIQERRSRGEEPTPTPSDEAVLLAEIRDLLRSGDAPRR
jgi:large conductance mechanosensitive channel